ncbi:MAG TPA: zinc ribbon domain-containing protein [Terriglobales bacterium]|nr:zinc ribbon domain-containing protein [Terriglobales bacterium]
MDYVTVEEQKPQISEELRLIPMWSVALAIVLFAVVQAVVHLYLTRHQHNIPPRGFLVFWSLAWGTVIAVYTMMVGYVTRDAKRRGMNRGLWIPLVIFMPGAIGLVLYFLLRQPIMMACPQCSASVIPGMNFCPQCRFQLAPTCHQCQRTVRITDVFCGNCGENLAESHAYKDVMKS